MARKIREAKLETRTARLKLEPRRKPYFTTIASGVSLGYRPTQWSRLMGCSWR